MNTIKIIAVDLDGTLLDVHGRVHDQDAVALKAAANAGVVTAIATGRLFSGARAAAHAAHIVGPVVCVDGAHAVMANSREELWHRPIGSAHARTLQTALAAHPQVAAFVFAHDEVLHDAAGDIYLNYIKTWSQETRGQRNVLEHDHWQHPRGISQVACVGPQDAVAALGNTLDKALGDTVLVARFPIHHVYAGVAALLVRDHDCTKGTALQALATRLGCTMEQVAVVGDWFNDVSMFAVAGQSFAMGQAPAAVKDAATHVLTATHHTGGGVAQALKLLGIVP